MLASTSAVLALPVRASSFGNAVPALPDHALSDPHAANHARDQPYFLIPRGNAAARLINRPRIVWSKTTSQRPKPRRVLLVNAVFVAKMRSFCRCRRVLAMSTAEKRDFNLPLTIHRANSAYLAASARG
jgi:hypothetical protein